MIFIELVSVKFVCITGMYGSQKQGEAINLLNIKNRENGIKGLIFPSQFFSFFNSN